MAIVLVPGGYAQASPTLDKLIQAARSEGELNLVAGGGTWGEAKGVKVIQDALNKKYGLNVKIRYAAGPSMAVMGGRVLQSYKSGVKSDTDLYVGNVAHMPAILKAKAAKSFPWRKAFPYIPEKTIQFDGQIIAFCDTFKGITYNTRQITGKQVPRRLEDVLDPKWKGKIASTPYAASLYLLASDRVWGYEKAAKFVQALRRQIGGLIRCGEEARIASGEWLMLVLNCGNYGPDYYGRNAGAPVGTLIPEDAAMMDSFYYVVPKNSAHPNLATLLAGFLMSKEGQGLLYSMVGWSSSEIEGTPAQRKLNELKRKGVKVHYFPAPAWMGKEGEIIRKANDEFKKTIRKK